MTKNPSASPPRPDLSSPPRADLNGLVGTIFSSIGLVGWVLTIAVLFSFQYNRALTGDGQRDLLIHMDNGLVYLARVAAGLFGLLVFGFFSVVGAIVSALGFGQERSTLSRAGFGLGAAGIVIACGLLLWRLVAWGIV